MPLTIHIFANGVTFDLVNYALFRSRVVNKTAHWGSLSYPRPVVKLKMLTLLDVGTD